MQGRIYIKHDQLEVFNKRCNALLDLAKEKSELYNKKYRNTNEDKHQRLIYLEREAVIKRIMALVASMITYEKPPIDLARYVKRRKPKPVKK